MNDDTPDDLAEAVGAARDNTDALGISARQFASVMTRAFAQAVSSGKQFDDVLKRVALSLSKLALQEAFKPLAQEAAGGFGDDESPSFMGGGVMSAASSINVQIATPDADSFRRSEAYVTGQIARAVARGQRGF